MKPNVSKKVKMFKIKTTTFQKVGRIIFWTFFVFLVLRGIGSLFTPDETGKAEASIRNFEKSIGDKQRLESGGKSYAEAFAYEYMTYDPNDTDDYRQRLMRFLPAYMDEFGYTGNTYTSTQVLSSSTYDVEWISENQMNVSVWLNVEYKSENSSGEVSEDTLNNEKKVKYKATGLKVPVAYVNGRYAIEDYPVFVALPEKANINLKSFTGYNAEVEETKEITEVLNSFFKTYYSGSPGEISYYMQDSKEVKGLENSFLYNRMGNAEVFVENKDSTDKKYIALVEVYITDPNSQKEIKQKYYINLTYDGQRYYIRDLNVRTVNLN